MSVTPDDFRAAVARSMRGSVWLLVVLIASGATLHAAGLFRLPPGALAAAVALLGVAWWQARLVESGDQPQARLLVFHFVLVAGVTFVNYQLGGIRFPAGALFYALLVTTSGFSAPLRYVFANLSAAAYAVLLGLEMRGDLPPAVGAFPGLIQAPPPPVQITFLAAVAICLNLLAAATQRWIGLLDWSRQRLAHANLELEGWRRSLADQVRERTHELEAANLELDARARALQERSHRLRTFVYTVTHDLKTPVNTVVLLCDLMLRRDGERLGAEGRHDLERIGALAGRTEHMIRDLFALFQITSAQEERRWVSLDEVAGRALDDLGPQIAAKRIALHVETLPRVWGAPGKLQHVLANLLTNAVKYVPASGGEITLGGRSDDGRVLLTVGDNGPGIAPEYHEGIFKLFGRVPCADAAVEGTGVGLAIVRGIVEEHGGRVWVESEPGIGSRFHVELPAGPPGRPLPLPE